MEWAKARRNHLDSLFALQVFVFRHVVAAKPLHGLRDMLWGLFWSFPCMPAIS